MKASLLDLVVIQMNRRNVEELRSLDKWEKQYLGIQLKTVSPDLVSLPEWNSIILTVLGDAPRENAEDARDYLIRKLCCE